MPNFQGLNKEPVNTEVQRDNISAIFIPKICITWPKQFSKVGDWQVWKYGSNAPVTQIANRYCGGCEGKLCMHCPASQPQRGLTQGWHQIYTNGTRIHRKRRPLSPWLRAQTEPARKKNKLSIDFAKAGIIQAAPRALTALKLHLSFTFSVPYSRIA